MGNIESLFDYKFLENSSESHINIEILPNDGCKNSIGILHGGIIALMIDKFAFSLPRLHRSNDRHLTTKLTVEYLKISRIQPLVGEISMEDELGPITVKLYNQSSLIAHGTVEFVKIKKKI